MEVTNIVCPVCTLYLRPGITLKQHLTSHPKHKVIEALVRLSCGDGVEKIQNSTQTTVNAPSASQGNAAALNQVSVAQPQDVNSLQGNHVFIYQQSMSTTSPHQPNVLNINPLNHQYVIPAVFNPQMMPYVYQQQQVIMSSNTIPPHLRALPFELPSSSQINEVTIEVPKEKSQEDRRITEIEEQPENIQECEVSAVPASSPVKKQEEDEDDDFGSEDMILSDGIEEEYHESDIDYENNHNSNHEECSGTPLSQANSGWGFHSELNKACQTQNATNASPRPVTQEEVLINNIEPENETGNDGPEYYYFNQENNAVTFASTSNNYEQSEPIYTSANILHANEPIDFVTMDDIDGMQVIIGDFTTGPAVSQVENFENTRPERPGVLMTIGEIETNKNDYNQRNEEEESANVNIRSDEKMPPRGELSGQESMGSASDIAWTRAHYPAQSSSGVFEIDSWEDSSSVEVPLQSRVPIDVNYDETPVVVSYSGPPLNFKCSGCEEAFASSKERKEHELEKHPEKAKKCNIIGLEIDKSKTKKLTIKPKQHKPENCFDNVFTNKLKLEENQDNHEDTKFDEAQVTLEEKNEVKIEESNVEPCTDLKTVCHICDGVFENKKALRNHLSDRHNMTSERRPQCLTCSEVFPNEYKYTEHLKIHPLECRLCGKLFYRRQNIQLHIKRHLGLKPFKCDSCDKSFVTKQKRDEHGNTHTGNAPIKCHMCDETFKRHSNLVQHRNRHHFQMKKKLKDYICFCGEILHSKKKLAWHKEIHDSKPKACTHCSEKFVHMASLTRHMRRAHNSEYLPEDRKNQQVNAVCPICKGTYLRSSLDAHLRKHSGQRPFTCLICNKDFTTKWNLKLHKWTHASRTQKPFKCDQCKGAFIRESDYIAHMNSHKSVRPYTCNYCGAQFIRKYNCHRHVKEHENNKTFSCNVCGKSFHRSYYLKDHMRVHSGIRPFACHICGKTSTTKSNHNKHVQIHHAREPVSTEN